MYLLDTNHCSYIIQRRPALRQRLDEIGMELITTCAIVRGELIYMAERSARRADNFALVHSFLERIIIYPVDDLTADIYGEFKAQLMRHFGPREKSKQRRATIQQYGISDNDLWIACIALQHGLTVVSADSDFKRMDEVRPLPMETWAAPTAGGGT